jgi:lysophospholipase L1-like esterase
MKFQLSHTVTVVSAAAFLSCAGPWVRTIEPADRKSNERESSASAVPPGKPAQATETAAAVQPIPRTDPNSIAAHAQLLEKTQKGKIDVYFEGDSITRRWGATDYPHFLVHWTRHFRGWNAADFGWGGDTAQNILWRLQNGELDGVHPKVIVLLAGTNDVGNAAPEGGIENLAARVTNRLKAIMDVLRKKAPDATLVVTGIFPRNDNMAVMPIINRINENLSQLADGKKIRYLNINDRLADENGRLFDGMTVDGLHPAINGYEIWAQALKPILRELLGPPGDVDYGPPATGDPSAKANPR